MSMWVGRTRPLVIDGPGTGLDLTRRMLPEPGSEAWPVRASRLHTVGRGRALCDLADPEPGWIKAVVSSLVMKALSNPCTGGLGNGSVTKKMMNDKH
jgi:hypothetical protein